MAAQARRVDVTDKGNDETEHGDQDPEDQGKRPDDDVVRGLERILFP